MHVIVRTCIFLTTASLKGHSRSLSETLLHKDFVLTHVSQCLWSVVNVDIPVDTQDLLFSQSGSGHMTPI